MNNVGTVDVEYEYVGQVKMTLRPTAKVYVDRAFKIRFFDGLPEKAAVSETQASGVPEEQGAGLASGGGAYGGSGVSTSYFE